MANIRTRVSKLEKVASDAGTIFVLRERGESRVDFQKRVKAAHKDGVRTIFSLNLYGDKDFTGHWTLKS